MIRVMTRKTAALVLLTLLILSPATAVAGDKEGPSSKEVKRMIAFGITLGKQGLWKEALYRWREALRHDPDNPQLLNNIAVALESQGDLEGAREAYARAMELDDSARYIERNIRDFEELFTALKEYEAQYRKPPPAAGEGGDDAAEDGKPAEGESALAEDAAEEDGDPPPAEAAAGVDEPGSGPDEPAGGQSAEDQPAEGQPAEDQPGEDVE